MNAFEFVIAIIVLSFIYKLLDVWMRQKHQRRDDDAAATAAAAVTERLQRIEERVRVLERIVTDERYELKQQFRDLGS